MAPATDVLVPSLQRTLAEKIALAMLTAEKNLKSTYHVRDAKEGGRKESRRKKKEGKEEEEEGRKEIRRKEKEGAGRGREIFSNVFTIGAKMNVGIAQLLGVTVNRRAHISPYLKRGNYFPKILLFSLFSVGNHSLTPTFSLPHPPFFLPSSIFLPPPSLTWIR
jgi:hypothetical protein